ncbi:MAG: hypothetical protein LBT89_09125 [Planctomycetaceae bacterium]|nr:hypothetical protein [Planctomycetaceae bacterium]
MSLDDFAYRSSLLTSIALGAEYVSGDESVPYLVFIERQMQPGRTKCFGNGAVRKP